MELKKNPEADLEKKKGFFFQIGLVLVLALILISFEWKVYDVKVSELGKLKVEQEEEELIPITRQELTPPPPPPPKPTQIEIVKDEEVIKEEVVISTESTEETEVKIVEQVEEVVEETQIFTIVEDMPRFPGCEKESTYEKKMACAELEMRKYLRDNIKFPRMAIDAGISGTVYVGFVVSTNGNIEDVKVLKGLGGGCDEEAIRVVKNMPSWSPGKQRNKPVKVQYTLPIKFSLK